MVWWFQTVSYSKGKSGKREFDWLVVRNAHLRRYIDSSADKVKPLETQQLDRVKNTSAFEELKRETYISIE